MAILQGDIKLVKSQVMDDVPEGGGAPSGQLIRDGESNAIHPDISEVARAGGKVSVIKVFAHVQTLDTDSYLDSNVIVAEPPLDPNVSITLMSTGDTFDRRDAARNRIESYLVYGSEWPGFLLENHVAGQRVMQLFQRPGTAPPNAGQTLVLVYNESTPALKREQYVRVTKTSSVLRTYTAASGAAYQAAVVSCELSDPLRYDFTGTAANELFKRDAAATKTRETSVANAAKYGGVASLTAGVAVGDLACRVDSVFTRLVPSAQTETPLLDLTAGGTSEALIESDNGTVSYTTSAEFNSATVLSVGNAIQPGSLSITVGGATLTDNGGDLMSGATVVGTINYGRGQVTLALSAPTYTGSKTITFRPAAAPIRVADTAGMRVDIESRSYNYILTIIPGPSPGTLQVSYRAQGQWYDLRDNGAGVLKGTSPEYGIGTVNYLSGTAAVTLGALPDVGSEIIYAWGAKASYFNRSGQTIASPSLSLQLSNAGVTPGSVAITWNDGTARSASDDGKGAITGNATGTINYQTGLIQMTPTALPAGGQTYSVAYTWGPPSEEAFHAPLRNGDGSIDVALAFGGLIPGTVELEWNLLANLYEYISTTPAELRVSRAVDPIKIVRDNGSGVLRDPQGTVFGTVDYATGAVHWLPDTTVRIPVARYTVTQIGWTRGSNAPVPVYRNLFSHWEYITAGASMPVDESGLAKVRYRAAGTSNAVTDSFTAGALAIDLTPSFAENIVPGSINFTLGGKIYFDRLGSLYYNLDPVTGAATLAGSINYATGAASVTAWTPAASNAVTLRSLLTTLDGSPVDEVTFRIPASPVRPGSLQLLATRLTGGTINVRANNTGEITSADVSGAIDYETGVVRVRFGAWVAAAGNEGQIWYDPRAVVVLDGVPKIFRPAPVFADTIKYNAVAYSYLPLDASLLGLDPVRLPSDGRVPIFNVGDYAVLGHGKRVSATLTQGQVIDCGRVRLSRVRLTGADGQVIDSGYSADLDAGTVTIEDPSGWAQPVTIEDRIEDMLRIADVEISGRVAFVSPATHAYPAGQAQLSSALMAGTLKARVSSQFSQQTWGNAWSDALSGSASTAKYDDIHYPISVTNLGAVTERWALVFTNSTTFNLVGEHLGQIVTGASINVDLAPINPATNAPYFTMKAAGFGSGWAAGNAMRINTIGALFPLWCIRTVQMGASSVIDDRWTLLVRGDVDRP